MALKVGDKKVFLIDSISPVYRVITSPQREAGHIDMLVRNEKDVRAGDVVVLELFDMVHSWPQVAKRFWVKAKEEEVPNG